MGGRTPAYIALARAEARRLVTTPRWIVAGVAVVLVAVLGAEAVAGESVNAHLAASALDVHAAASNNLMYVGYILFVSFVFVVGDGIARDRATGYTRLLLVRGVGRRHIWASKVLSVALGAALIQVALLVACIVVGRAVQGLLLAAQPSALAIASADAHSITLFAPVAADANMLVRQVAVSVHLVLGFGALACVLLAASIRYRSGRLPVALALLGLMADHVAAKAWEPWHVLSPGLRLLESSSSHFSGEALMSHTASAVYFGVMLAGAVLVGGWLYQRAEL